MDRIGERLAGAVTGSDDLTKAMESLWKAFDDNPAFINIGSWMILDGHNMSEVMSKHPAARDLINQASQRGMNDPQTFDQRIYQSAAEALSLWAGH
jgi:hypothetical protein